MPPRIGRIEGTRLPFLHQRQQRLLMPRHGRNVEFPAIPVLRTPSRHLKGRHDHGEFGISGEPLHDRGPGEKIVQFGGGPKVHVGVDGVRGPHARKGHVAEDVDGVFGAGGVVARFGDGLYGELVGGAAVGDELGGDVVGGPVGEDDDGEGVGFAPAVAVVGDHPDAVFGELGDEGEGDVGGGEGGGAGGGVGGGELEGGGVGGVEDGDGGEVDGGGDGEGRGVDVHGFGDAGASEGFLFGFLAFGGPFVGVVVAVVVVVVIVIAVVGNAIQQSSRRSQVQQFARRNDPTARRQRPVRPQHRHQGPDPKRDHHDQHQSRQAPPELQTLQSRLFLGQRRRKAASAHHAAQEGEVGDVDGAHVDDGAAHGAQVAVVVAGSGGGGAKGGRRGGIAQLGGAILVAVAVAAGIAIGKTLSRRRRVDDIGRAVSKIGR
mmetsp:Transcript_5511/g.11310  ORF Transcript_5511/g.11310 Transcript_5511/m.11310 type:complete len:432 (-) Transcript_5511:579-1874(-)